MPFYCLCNNFAPSGCERSTWKNPQLLQFIYNLRIKAGFYMSFNLLIFMIFYTFSYDDSS
jgi:hypothetical protein